jgi:hypothetical protein
MSLTVTLNVFSGRRNPVWILPDEASEELNTRIASIATTSNLKAAPAQGVLGYRGFSVRRNEEPHTTFIHGGIVDPDQASPSLIADDREIEKWLLSTAGDHIAEEVRAHIEESLRLPVSSSALKSAAPVQCPQCVAADAPAYNPGAWNIPTVQPYNNCYNYANNRITNTFAQPGRATGHMYTQLNTCVGAGAVQPAAISDGLVVAPNFTTPRAAGNGYYVALVLWPGTDFHWYRQDNVGCWSHKPGGTPVVNVDNAGNPITNPQTANRGPYTVFCTFMVTGAGVNIS